jgi:hypothetical protein
MKSILLASVSAFAFAGAAAADVTWSGSASASYNSVSDTPITTEVTLGAAASLAGDWTLSTSISMDDEGDWTTGSISMTDGTSSVTFGVDHAFGAAGLDDEDADDESADVSVSTTMGGVAVTATIDTAEDGNTEIGAAMSAGGADIEVGFVAAGAGAGDFRLGLSTSVGGADVAFNTSSVEGETAWDASIGMAVAGADLTFSTASDETYDLGVSYAMGDVTVSAGIDETVGNYTLGVDYAAGGVGVSFSTDQDNAWAASVSYAEGAVSVAASFDADGLGAVDASYDLGGGMVAYFGSATNNYVGLEMDLGGGASLAVSYADAAGSDDDAKNYAEGSTIAVSFDF